MDFMQCLPLSSFDAGCVPVRKGGRLVWVSPGTPAGSSSLPWSGTVRWRAADLKITGTNKVKVCLFNLIQSHRDDKNIKQECLINKVSSVN